LYVNDNSDLAVPTFNARSNNACATGRGRPLGGAACALVGRLLRLSPTNPAFFSTTLDVPAEAPRHGDGHPDGLAGDKCVLFTANDAYPARLRVVVPSTCVAS